MHTAGPSERNERTSQWKILSVSELSVKMAINQAVIISSEDLSSGRRLVCLEKHVEPVVAGRSTGAVNQSWSSLRSSTPVLEVALTHPERH